MTTRSQKREAQAELVSGEFKASIVENLEEIKTSLRKEIMSDLAKLLAENQKKIMKLVVLSAKKSSGHQNTQDSDSETENISEARMSTSVKTNTAAHKTTPINSRNNYCFQYFLCSSNTQNECMERRSD